MEIPGIWEYSWYDARFWERGPGEEPQTSKAEACATLAFHLRLDQTCGGFCLGACRRARESDQNNTPAEMRIRARENRTIICV